MEIKDLGESGTINRLKEITNAIRKKSKDDLFNYRLLVDNGDDAAAWKPGSVTELATTDTMVEGVHFTRSTMSWYQIGWKLMAANISDIAAMGGLPLFALVTLGIPSKTKVNNIDQLYLGLTDLGTQHNMRIVGGDVVRSSKVFLTISLIGATEYAPLLRSNAKDGDLIAVTGNLGSAEAGLNILTNPNRVHQESLLDIIKSHQLPNPNVQQGIILAREGVKCAMDVSDGLIADLSKICEASKVSARIKFSKLPMDPKLKKAFPTKYANMALTGGEDYVLVFTAKRNLMKKIIPILPPPAQIIGDVHINSRDQVSVLNEHNEPISILKEGWDHFK